MLAVKRTKKRISKTIAVVAIATAFGFAGKRSHTRPLAPTIKAHHTKSITNTYQDLYDRLGLATSGLSRNAFDVAVKGFETLVKTGRLLNEQILTIADFSLPSTKKRLFIIDLTDGSLLFNTYVTHGRNSGKVLATRFSNRNNSFQSSVGFFVTRDTYLGKHGYSLRLDGVESGINDNALKRGIVIHSADYAEGAVAEKQGYLGRSLGCPAIPESIHKPVIETIRNGSCFFIYAPSYTLARGNKLI